MSVSKDMVGQAPPRRSQREALERWMAQADALLAAQGDGPGERARGSA